MEESNQTTDLLVIMMGIMPALIALMAVCGILTGLVAYIVAMAG